jgi:hypothetical protein
MTQDESTVSCPTCGEFVRILTGCPGRIQLPIIHINGSGLNLIKEFLSVRTNLSAAIDALRQAAPHPRDYYPVPGSYDRALNDYESRVARMISVVSELDVILEHVYQSQAPRSYVI